MKSGLKIDIKYPSRLGADRIASAAGAFALMGGPLIVVTSGTATTIDCVTENGRFLGGAIAPGPAMFTEYLASSAELLPRVAFPARVPPIGRSTIGALQVGSGAGYPGMVEGIIKYLSASLIKRGTNAICVTGGGAPCLRKMKIPVRVEKDLTFLGMLTLWQMNADKK